MKQTLKCTQGKQIFSILFHINCLSKCLLEWVNLREANVILSILVLVYQYFFRCHIYCLGNFMEDFLYSVRIHKLILMSYFKRYLQSLVRFWQSRNKWEVDSSSKLREQSGFTVSWKYCLNSCSLRRLKGAGYAEVYINLFEISSVRQVFKVGVSSVL